jgi:hypothetical protein
MPATTFKTPLNNVSTTVGATRGVGVASLTVATGTGGKFGSPSPSAPIRVTVIQAAGISGGIITDPTKLTIFSCTGRSGDVLSGLTVIESTTDLAFANGDTIIMAPTAEAFGDIHGAINALENATTQASVAANQIYAGPTTGAAASPTFRAGVAADVPNLDAAKITTGTLVVARGGTGQSAYTDGQLLIGNTATGGLSKATLTPGTNVTITNANGAITIAASGGGGGTPGGANTQIQVNSTGAFAGYASFTYNSTTFVQTIGDATGAAQLTLNNNVNNNPTIKVNGTASQQGLTIVVGAATVCQFHDTGLVAVGSLGTLGGMNFGDFFVQRGTGPKVDWGNGLGSTIAVMVTEPSANAGYNYTFLVAGSRAAAVSGAVSGFSGQTTDIWQVTKNDQSVYWANDKLGRPYSKNTTATIAAGAGAGTTPTVSVAGTDVNGVVTVTTGTTPGASAVVATVSFSVALTQAGTSTVPKTVILTPANAAASALSGAGKVWADSAALAAASFTLNSGTAALTAATTYKWYYLAVG